MKTGYVLLLIYLMIMFFISCSNKKQETEEIEKVTKTENLDDLIFKYNEIKVVTCDEIFAIGDEMYDIYINTIYRADEGDEKALGDLMSFHLFRDKFEEKLKTLTQECPEDFKAWSKKIEKRMEGPNHKLKLIELYQTEYSPIKLENNISEELNLQLNELNLKLKEIYYEDSINNIIVKNDSIIS